MKSPTWNDVLSLAIIVGWVVVGCVLIRTCGSSLSCVEMCAPHGVKEYVPGARCSCLDGRVTP